MGSLIGTEAIYAFSSDATIATVPTTSLSYSVDSAVVTVTGVKAGTATITFGNATTLAASTIKSAPVSVRVGSTAIASVTLAFDKTSYAPGEKAVITLSTLDATNLLTVPGDVKLATAIQGTVVSATVNVVDSGSAALAAVTALATTVASLRTLIVTLTNLVLKIQKKVKA
jgi:hypothetical protein